MVNTWGWIQRTRVILFFVSWKWNLMITSGSCHPLNDIFKKSQAKILETTITHT